jgi:hypothetical protein
VIAAVEAYRKRAERSEARLADALAALSGLSEYERDGGPCWCFCNCCPHHEACLAARRIIAEQPSRQGDAAS